MSLFLFTYGEIVGLGTAISISQPLSCTSNPNTTFSESFTLCMTFSARNLNEQGDNIQP